MVDQHGEVEEAPELLTRYVRLVGIHMLACFLVVIAAFLVDAVLPDGVVTWQRMLDTAERWSDAASGLALPTLAVIVGLLLPLYLAPLGSKDLERKATRNEDSLTASEHEILAIQDVRENLILLLATVGSILSWWMAPTVLKHPVFGVVVVVLAAVFGALAIIREATFGRAAVHVLRSHRAHRGLTFLLEQLGVQQGTRHADLTPQIRAARRRELLLQVLLALTVVGVLWLVAVVLELPSPLLDTAVVSIVAVPYLLFRWTGTRRSRIRRAKAAGSTQQGIDPSPLLSRIRHRRARKLGMRVGETLAGSILVLAVDLTVLGVLYVLTHASLGTHLGASGVLLVLTVLLLLLVLVVPRRSRAYRLLLIDAALHARRRVDVTTPGAAPERMEPSPPPGG